MAAVNTKRGYVGPGMCNGRSAPQESGAALSTACLWRGPKIIYSYYTRCALIRDRQPTAWDGLVWFPDPSIMRMRGRGKKGLGNNYTPARALEFDLHVPLSGCG